MRKLLTFLFFGASGVFSFLFVGAQGGDTQGVSLQVSAKSGLYDKVAVLNYIQNQEYDEAIAYLAPILQVDSGNASLLGYAGYAYYMNADAHSAAACYLKLLTIDSNNIPALHYLLLMDMNDRPAEAMDYASRLVRLQRTRAPWWRLMGELFARAEQKDSARFYYEKAYALAPGDIRTIEGLVSMLLGDRDFGRADSILAVAQDRDSLNPTVQKLAVRSAYLSQHYAAAIVPGERLVRSDEPAGQALTSLALSYYSLKQYPDCIRVCDHMLDLGLQDQAVFYYEARAWTKMKEYAISDSLLRMALKFAILPTAEWYFDDLASNHESLKEYREAVRNYDSAYYLFKDPLVLYACGRICETELKDLVSAGKYYRRYMAVAKPVSKEEKEALVYVRRRWGKK